VIDNTQTDEAVFQWQGFAGQALDSQASGMVGFLDRYVDLVNGDCLEVSTSYAGRNEF
jgi:hypothetical protein